jgi:hypothetical protein
MINSFKFIDRKVVIRIRGRACETAEELLSSDLFRHVLTRCVEKLMKKGSFLLNIFGKDTGEIGDSDIQILIRTLQFLAKMPVEFVPRIVDGSKQITADTLLLRDFVEYIYNCWREFERFLVCDAEADNLDARPYRTFSDTIEALTDLARGVYRDIEENITGEHPRIYRQVRAGAEFAVITTPKPVLYPAGPYSKLKDIPLIRQILLYPPLILNPPMNKRSGRFERVDKNPLDLADLKDDEWLCYPARVGTLLILVYFQERFFDLGFALCNLFELADDDALTRRPDAIYLYGVPGGALDTLAPFPTVFYDDAENNMLVGAVPNRNEFGYFGYLKKMMLTLYNIVMMKQGNMPFHGAMVSIRLKEKKEATILIMGDTGTGKSETLEAFRALGEDLIQDIVIIADDMGSLTLEDEAGITGYGTEVGAYVRLDDLQPGFAFGQIDRTIIMNASQVNARVILPVTTYEVITRGYPVDLLLYANNYEQVDEDHAVIEQFHTAEQALSVFREGAAMSKGTTTATGLVHSYFANVFGPVQYRSLHESISKDFFQAFFRRSVFVGQIRTRLGIEGFERSGPEEAAKALIRFIGERNE